MSTGNDGVSMHESTRGKCNGEERGFDSVSFLAKARQLASVLIAANTLC